ncbi:hypothetical protein [Lentzea sp. NEAU-D7]|uniref:hypothetical protein n=1 Tax=Lentzea sp. NEAU-D7 TaxID=2994667 RepID=UPI00224B4C3F|nr:hypothetical protein [Lentzea sp. NEAU-D7]MCX2950400.1 hypothetical protein [Lentzea sp. NEAU-D7]
MRNLERRYRTLLKVLPRWYRRDREEEMVGIFLADRDDDLDLEHSWPGWGETWAVLGLAVRTHLAAGAALTSVPAKVVWRGEVVRALGMLGLLLGVFFAMTAVVSVVVGLGRPYQSPDPWWRVLELAPVVAFAALLWGRRTPAKVAAAVPALAAVVSLGEPGYFLTWSVFQVPPLVTFVCLCLGFHRDAPTPPARRMLWWGGGAALIGVIGGVSAGTGMLTIGLITVVLRVISFVRGDFVLGRALSFFAALQLVPLLSLVIPSGGFFVPAGLVAALLVLAVVLPVRRRSKAAPQVT